MGKSLQQEPIKLEPRGELKAGWLSRVTFSWVSQLVSAGYKRQLQDEDLWDVQRSERTAILRRAAVPKLEKNAVHTHKELMWLMLNAGRREVLISGVFMLFYTAGQLLNPLLLRELVQRVENQDFDGIYIAVALFFNSVLAGFSGQQQAHFSFTAGRKARSLYISLVYEHTLRLNSIEMGETSIGEILNMMSADAQKFFEISQMMHLMWAGPLQIIVAVALLLNLLGVPALAGFVILLATLPINVFMARWKKSLRTRHMPFMDQRVKLCNEILSGIRVVKMFSWEHPFFAKISEIRSKQLKYVFAELRLAALGIFVLIIAPGLASLATFASSGTAESPLTPGNTFAALALFNVLKFPLMMIAQVLMLAAQVSVGLDRLSKFLALGPRGIGLGLTSGDTVEDDGTGSDISLKSPKEAEAAAKAVSEPVSRASPDELLRFSGASFAWTSSNAAENVLSELDLTVKRGELVAVVGPVGSGKSSLCHAMLNELRLTEGSFENFKGEIAFCSQSPWILNATVEENITFGKPFDPVRFREALDACCLWSDLDLLSEREKTVIGERGVTLSGGQKARISLARAAYARAELVILDDPLSALDAHVGKQVFKQLLAPKTGLLTNVTRILVTHAAQNLGACDKVVVVYRGKIAYQGLYDELEQMRSDEEQGIVRESSVGLNADASLATVMDTLLLTTQTGADDTENKDESNDATSTKTKKQELLGTEFKSTALMTTEKREEGAVNGFIVDRYIKAAGGYLWVLFVIILMVTERVTYIASDYWLATWTEAENGPPEGKFYDFPAGNTDEGLLFYKLGYLSTISINAFFVFARTYTFMLSGGIAAKALFSVMTWSVLRSPMVFFETTPLGRVTNRFSFDTEIVDDVLIQTLNGMIASSMWLLSSVIVMISVTPLATVLIGPVMILFAFMHRYYRRSCVDLQRLDSTSRSPIQSHFRETIEGLPTIRAYRQEDRFLSKGDVLVDTNNKAIFAFVSSNRWLGLRLEFLGSLVTFSVALSAWLGRETISPGLVGLAILWSFNLTTSFNFFVIQSALSEAKMTSVERIIQYSQLEQEPELQVLDKSPPSKNWPEHGNVEFKNVVMRYRPDLDPVLRDISFKINAGEHVGICGRTGSSKSTTFAALLRLRELDSGCIEVDGVDISKLGLADVRGRAVTIIPQDPTLFTGTVRFNVDPFGDYSDTQVLEALNHARLGKYVEQLGGLEGDVGEGGSNLSQGQRQLMCLSRAILRQPKVLLCDEMTSSVDGVTDALIQKTIRSVFAESTVITVAHRLHSIMDSDRIIVLDQGRVAEIDTPANLLEQEGSAFRSLVESNGPAVAAELKSLLR